MYDYIIVGAGSAGCVLANRLSENPKNKVCVIEAGSKDWHPSIKLPVGIAWLMRSKTLNWNYNTQPEKNLNNRRLFWPRGKTLGGSSASNAMVYIRGHKQDYDHWESLGNKGWSFNDLLPYFRRSEHQERGNDKFHGSHGPLNVQDFKVRNKLASAFVKAGVQAGYRKNQDFNGPEQEGIGFYQVTQKEGRRCSSAAAFLRSSEQRDNLTIITKAQVSHLQFDKKNESIIGVSFLKNNKTYNIKASREVIVSSGAINSPQILMLSGIGEKNELEKHGIEVKHELNGVGKNLQDHLDVMLVQKSLTADSYGLTFKNLITHTPYHLYQYLVKKRGMFSSNANEAGGFIKSEPSQAIPDLQFHFGLAKLRDHGRNLSFMMGDGYSLHICNLRPKSRGTISLNSANPMDHACINGNYLSAEEDMDTMIKGVKAGLKILNADAFDKHRGKQLTPEFQLNNDADIRRHIHENAETIYHPVGTCKMGNDKMAVVNERLQVHGIKRLRVVDASIMPTLIGGNTNAPAIAIAEKAADMIIQDAQGLSARMA